MGEICTPAIDTALPRSRRRRVADPNTSSTQVLAESAVPGSNPQYKILNIDMTTSDVDIMGSVIPQLTSPFALKAYPVLAICALVQQQRSLKN